MSNLISISPGLKLNLDKIVDMTQPKIYEVIKYINSSGIQQCDSRLCNFLMSYNLRNLSIYELYWGFVIEINDNLYEIDKESFDLALYQYFPLYIKDDGSFFTKMDEDFLKQKKYNTLSKEYKQVIWVCLILKEIHEFLLIYLTYFANKAIKKKEKNQKSL